MDQGRPHAGPPQGFGSKKHEGSSAELDPFEAAWADAIGDGRPSLGPAVDPEPGHDVPDLPDVELDVAIDDPLDFLMGQEQVAGPQVLAPMPLPELPPVPAEFITQPGLHARVPIAPPAVPSAVAAPRRAVKIARRLRRDINLAPKGKVVLGIDLGTTNCCAALIEDGRAHVLASRWGTPTIPSAVCFNMDGSLLVGRPAFERAASNAKHTVLGAKRLVGRPFHSPIVQMVREHFAYNIVQGDLGEAAILIENEIVSLEEISAHLLEEIRTTAELQLDTVVNRAVITCPAFFNERQREAVRVAGELAGFHVERVLSEPTAAALEYGLGQGFETRKVMVYDLGGGTFDVSLLEVDGSVFEVLATGGDTFLGGVDFDACLAEMIVHRFVQEHGLDPRADETAMATVFQHAERAKIALSERPSTIVHIEGLAIHHHPAKDLLLPLRRGDVDARFDVLLEHSFKIVSDVLKRVDLTVADIDDVLLVGGQTRYPLVRNRVREFYGQDPKESVNPDEAVARGAARYAAGLDSFDNVILIDALPMSIGIGLPGGKFEKLIERDTRLPSETTYSIRTVRNNQPEVTILIFQGEDDRVAHNEPLGMLVLSGLPKGPKGSVVIDIKLRVTEECILELSASERHSGRQMESKFATKDTPEALRKRLGLAPNPTSDEIDKRTAELDRPKSVWRWLTGVFER